jgi:hypothetical protein
VHSACSGAALGLEFRFANTHAMLCLHVWLALVRLRAEGKDGKDLAQMMYEDFQEDVEMRVRAEGVKVQSKPALWALQLLGLTCTLSPAFLKRFVKAVAGQHRRLPMHASRAP